MILESEISIDDNQSHVSRMFVCWPCTMKTFVKGKVLRQLESVLCVCELHVLVVVMETKLSHKVKRFIKTFVKHTQCYLD